ncbi:MAG: carboxymuconolactone decarboxylase family protein [Candidatus Marinimicrobia bacterium]|nr:carboxymuconolactone decarboxylase family protein [Candidatus Neomarinimicrobiota bacterium]
MAWIKWIDEAVAKGRLAQLIDRYKNRSNGLLDHIIKIHSLDEQTMEDHLRLYKRLMFGSSELSRTQREMIAVAVSVQNQCHY